MAEAGAPPPPGERRLLATLAAVQLVVVMDFTMMLPLGPDLVAPLGIDVASLPLLVGAQTGAAALAGILGGSWLERAPRRRAMVGLLLALLVAELVATQASDGATMLLARLLAGAAAGQLGALGLVVLSESIPEARRGRATGAVMAANALAAVAGVPLGLWLSGAFGWQAPFLWLAATAATAAALAGSGVPVTDVTRRTTSTNIISISDALAPLSRPNERRALLLTFLLVLSAFLLNPNLSAFVQHNLGLPRERLPVLYGVAGAVALVVVQLVGRAVDHWGALRVGAGAVAVFVAVVLSFLVLEAGVPVGLGFVLLLCSLQSRNVALRTLSTRVPRPAERGRFMSLFSSAQQLGSAGGALCSAALISTGADGRLLGMPGLGLLSVALALCTLPLLAAVERGTLDQPREG